MSRKCRVSLCLIVRDEAHNLEDCLTPVLGLVDEVIVVDTGSQDATREIARRLGAQVFDMPWQDSFAAARNETLRHATGDYILWLDADDRIEPESLEELAYLLTQVEGKRWFYFMDVYSRQFGHPTGTYTRHARLFPRLANIAWEYRVHEQIMPSLQRAGCDYRHTTIKIRHLGYEDGIRLRAKVDRDLRLARLDVVDHPHDPVVLHNVAHGYLRLGDTSQALMYYFQSLQHAKKAQDWVAILFCELAGLLNSLGRCEEAFGVASQGITNFPDSGDLLLVRGRVRYELGDFGGAERDFREAMKVSPAEKVAAARDTARLRREARRDLANALATQGQHLEAEEHFQRVLAEDPTDREAWIGLGELYIRWARYQMTEFVVQQLSKLPQGNILAACLRAQALRSIGQVHEAVELLQKTLALSVELEWPWIELIRATWAAGRFDECRTACQELARLSPYHTMPKQVLAELDQRSLRQLNSTIIVS